MTFTESVSTCLGKYADFEGRARRSEYWWFQLFQLLFMLLGAVGIVLAQSGMGLSEAEGKGLSMLCWLALTLPSMAVVVRRLHDVDRNGWWILIPCTIIGIIPFYYWMCKEGGALANQYGVLGIDTTHTKTDQRVVALKPAIALEDLLYAQIAQELDTNTVDKGLWTKIYAQAGGDDRQTRVCYIQARFTRLLAMEKSQRDAIYIPPPVDQ